MKTIIFTKAVASGNDFIIIDVRSRAARFNCKEAAQKLCHRTMGIGADGLLVLEKSNKADVRMRIFNADGSEAEMCGNGARCVAYFVAQEKKQKRTIHIGTKAGIIKAHVRNDTVKINMTQPRRVTLNVAVAIRRHTLQVNVINTGVPHVVILCEDVGTINVARLGSLLRYHRRFQPAGTNVNFVEPKRLDAIKVRTYERGVERETLACGTGSVASAIVYALKLKNTGLVKKDDFSVLVETASGEQLKVDFDIAKNTIRNVFLEGAVKIIFRGQVKTKLMERKRT